MSFDHTVAHWWTVKGWGEAEVNRISFRKQSIAQASFHFCFDFDPCHNLVFILPKKYILQNLEIKKINDEKKASMAAQFAAEATLRRVHAAQKDDDMPPIEAILAPLEAELKLAKQEVCPEIWTII